MQLIISYGFGLTAAGMLLGTIAALESTRLLGYLLYKVIPRDPRTFGSAVAIMTTASLLACHIPAWRAMRIDPCGLWEINCQPARANLRNNLHNLAHS